MRLMPMMIEPRAVRVAAVWLAALIAIAAIVNVPWAVTMIRSRENENKLPTLVRLIPGRGGQVPSEWPSRTPHPKPWPAPDYWTESGVFGCRIIDARKLALDTKNNGFTMQVQRIGWPLPVIEIKQMWWDWNDAALAGPESDPRPSLMLSGLVLNPLMLGGSAWLALFIPWLILTVLQRRSRRRDSRCLSCGYDLRATVSSGIDRCPECGGNAPTSMR